MNIKAIESFMKQKLEFEPSGHDYLHTMRVYHNALLLMDDEVNQDVVKVSCLIHDLIDHKLDDKYKASKEEIINLLIENGLSMVEIAHVFEIIENMSFSTGKVPSSIEGKVVQDADRLDALGAIGIARTFSFGGKHGRLIYDENTVDGEDSVSHIYQKLFHLKDLMNTEQGKIEAIKRTEYMKEFINRLYEEIDLKHEL